MLLSPLFLRGKNPFARSGERDGRRKIKNFKIKFRLFSSVSAGCARFLSIRRKGKPVLFVKRILLKSRAPSLRKRRELSL